MVDGRMLATEASGVATYARTLVAALRATGEAPGILGDAAAGRFGMAEPARAAVWRAVNARFRARLALRESEEGLKARDIFRMAQARFARTGRMLRLEAPGGGGIVHWTYPIPAYVAGWENLYTVHDVLPLTHPMATDMAAAPLRARLEAIAARAARIVTVSAHSRDEIVAALGVPANLVTDCGLATRIAEEPAGALPAGLSAGGYYLFCGSAEPRKNLPRTIAAWRAAGAGRPLVVAGAAIPPGIDPAGVIALGRIGRPDLVAAIGSARALLFPSLAEGFGLPIAEAMALGTPVLTANRGATAETAGDAALLVDPEDTGEIAAAIMRLDRDDGLAAMLTERGLARAERFSIRAFGVRLRALYAEIAGDSRAAP